MGTQEDVAQNTVLHAHVRASVDMYRFNALKLWTNSALCTYADRSAGEALRFRAGTALPRLHGRALQKSGGKWGKSAPFSSAPHMIIARESSCLILHQSSWKQIIPTLWKSSPIRELTKPLGPPGSDTAVVRTLNLKTVPVSVPWHETFHGRISWGTPDLTVFLSNLRP